MNFIFCKLKKPQKTWTSFFANLKNLKKHEFHFYYCKLSIDEVSVRWRVSTLSSPFKTLMHTVSNWKKLRGRAALESNFQRSLPFRLPRSWAQLLEFKNFTAPLSTSFENPSFENSIWSNTNCVSGVIWLSPDFMAPTSNAKANPYPWLWKRIRKASLWALFGTLNLSLLRKFPLVANLSVSAFKKAWR